MTDADSITLKTHDKLLIILIGMLFVLGILAFFRMPVYADLVKEVVREFVEGVGLILAFKFGIHQAQLQAGSTQVTQTTTPPAAQEFPKP